MRWNWAEIVHIWRVVAVSFPSIYANTYTKALTKSHMIPTHIRKLCIATHVDVYGNAGALQKLPRVYYYWLSALSNTTQSIVHYWIHRFAPATIMAAQHFSLANRAWISFASFIEYTENRCRDLFSLRVRSGMLAFAFANKFPLLSSHIFRMKGREKCGSFFYLLLWYRNK